MKKVLDLLCQRCPRMEEMLTSSPGGRLQAVLSHDEATAGNVLNPLLRKKISFLCDFHRFRKSVDFQSCVAACCGDNA